jgi:hypothetical protein
MSKNITYDYSPNYAIHPGEILEETIISRGISKSVLAKIDTIINEKIEIIMLGGTAVLFHCGDVRVTSDIDIYFQTDKYKDLFLKYNINNRATYVANMPENYESRIIRIMGNELDNLEVYILSKIDLVLTKTQRLTEKDVDDIEALIRKMEENEIKKLIFLGDKSTNEFLGVFFKDNWKYIKRRFLWKYT